MLQNLVTFVKTNKDQIIKKGAIVLGTLAAVALTGIVLKQNAENGDPIEVVEQVVENVAAE